MRKKRTKKHKNKKLLIEKLEQRVYLSATPVVELNIEGQEVDAQSFINEEFNVEVKFDNEGSDVGYGPYMDVFFEEGIDTSNLAASFLGQDLALTKISYDGAGNPNLSKHPLTNIDLNQDLSRANGTLLIVELPFGSYTPDQPELSVNFSGAKLTNDADLLGEPLNVEVVGGFRYGETPLNDPLSDPPIISNSVIGTITPTLYTVHKSNDAPESEIATGENYKFNYFINIDIADGQTLDDLVLTDFLHDGLVVTNILVDGSNGISLATLDGNNILPLPFNGNEGPFNGSSLMIDFDDEVGSLASDDITITLTGYFIDKLADGQTDVLNPQTGLPEPFENTVASTALYNENNYVANAEDTVVAKSLPIQKSVQILEEDGVTPKGTASPGDILKYTLSFQVSDYFSFDNITIEDILSDGQELLLGGIFDPTLTVKSEGSTLLNNNKFELGNLNSSISLITGETVIDFNVSGELVSEGHLGRLSGDIYANGLLEGATEGSIIFYAKVLEDYRVSPPSLDKSIDIKDKVTNSVQISGYIDENNEVTDESSSTVTIGSITPTKSVFAINGSDPGVGEVEIGDYVTYRLRIDLSAADIEDLSVTDYIPLPNFDVDELNVGSFTIGSSDPALGDFSAGDVHIVMDPAVLALLQGGFPALTVNSAENALKVNFGTFDELNSEPTTIDIYLSLTAKDVPTADKLRLTDHMFLEHENSFEEGFHQSSIAPVTILAPAPAITKGVVKTDQDGNIVGSTGPSGVVWSPVGSGGATFTGTLSTYDADNTKNVLNNPVDSNLESADAEDIAKYALVIQNTGSKSAYDILFKDTPPGDFSEPAGGYNLKIVTGDGVAYSLSDFERENGSPIPNENVFFNALFGNGIRLKTNNAISNDGLIGESQAQQNGNNNNVIVITYELLIDEKNTILAASEHPNEAQILQFYAQEEEVEGRTDWVAGNTNLNWQDDALVTIDVPKVDKFVQTTSLNNDPDTNVVIGELVTYRIKVTLPEGDILKFNVYDQIPDGMELWDASDGGSNPTIIIPQDFSGIIRNTGNNGPGLQDGDELIYNSGGGDGDNITFTFTQSEISGDNDNQNNFFFIEYTALVRNNILNQDGTGLQNRARVEYDNPATHSVDTDLKTGYSNASVNVIEPDLEVEKEVVVNEGTLLEGTQGDAHDPVKYTITIQHSSSSHSDAYDISFEDIIPNKIDSVTLVSATHSSLGNISGAFNVNGQTITLDNDENINLLQGESITIVITGNIVLNVLPSEEIDNTASIQWTSLPEEDPNERTGEGGVNDYVDTDGAKVTVFAINANKTIIATSESHTSFESGRESLAIGEIVRYRLVMEIPESIIPNYTIKDLLPNGLKYIDGTAKIAFVASNLNGLTTVNFGNNPYMAGDETTINSITPTFLMGDDTVSSLFGSDNDNYNSGTDVFFKLGKLTNCDFDANKEFIVIEFNALVLNSNDNDAFDNAKRHKDNRYQVGTGDPTHPNNRLATSNNALARIVEPNVSITKSIFEAPFPADAGNQVTYRLEITNNSGLAYEDAFDLFIEDVLDNDLNLINAQVVGGTGGSIVNINQIQSSPNDKVEVSIDKLNEGQTIVIEIVAEIEQEVKVGEEIPNKATVKYTSLPGGKGTIVNPTGSSTPGHTGDLDGERFYKEKSNKVIFDIDVPVIDKKVDKETHTIGEVVNYTVDIFLPEGVTPDLVFIDELEFGLQFLTDAVTVTRSSGDIMTDLGVGDFSDILSGSLSMQDQKLTLNLGTITNLNLDDQIPEKITITYKAYVTNDIDENLVKDNVRGDERSNVALAQWGGPGAGSQEDTETITIIEPTLQIGKEVNVAGSGDAGDTVTYTLTISHTDSSNADAFDLSLMDNLPEMLENFSITQVLGPANIGDFSITGSVGNEVLTISGDVDLALGQTLVIELTGTIRQEVSPVENIINQASVQWTSIDGVPGDNGVVNIPDERTGEDGIGGPIDDYEALSNTVLFTTPEPTITKAIKSTSESHTIGNDVTIGETVTYELTITLPEGTLPQWLALDNLPEGMAYVDGSAIINLSMFDGEVNPENNLLPYSNGDSLIDVTFVDNTLTLNFGETITNASLDGSLNNVIKIQYDAIVQNVASNQGDASETNTELQNQVSLVFPDPESEQETITIEAPENPTVTVIEPKLQVEKAVSTTSADAGDALTYTLTITHHEDSLTDAFDLSLADVLPTDFIGPFSISAAITPTNTDVSNDFEVVAGLLKIKDASNIDLAQGETLTIQIQGFIDISVEPQDNLLNKATVTWTSIDGTNPEERTGSEDPDFNDYTDMSEQVTTTINTITELEKSIALTSENFTGTSEGVEQFAIGEVVTYRLSVKIPEATMENFQIEDLLPAGLQYIDGSAKVALVANNIGISSLAYGGIPGISGAGLLQNGDSPAGITPTFILPDPNVSTSSVPAIDDDNYSPGTNVFFRLGTIVNADNDADSEYIVIEFDALVANIPENTQLAKQDNQFTVTTKEGDNRVNYGDSNIVEGEIVLPELNITKELINPPVDNTGDAGDVFTYEVTIEHLQSSLTDAFDLVITDLLPSGLEYAGNLTPVNGPLPTVDTNTPGTVKFNFDSLTLDQETYKFQFDVTIADSVTPLEPDLINFSNLTYDTLPADDDPNERDFEDEAQSGPIDVVMNYDIEKQLVSTSNPDTNTDQFDTDIDDLTIGEEATYEITVTFAEGTTPQVLISDLFSDPYLEILEAEVSFIGSNITNTAGLIVGSSGSLSDPGFLGYNTQAEFFFGDITNTGSNRTTPDLNDQIKITVKAVVKDIPENVQEETRTNTAQFESEETEPISSQYTIELVEPSLDVQKTVDDENPELGQTVTYTLTISHEQDSTASAYNLLIQDTLPTGFELLTGTITVNGASVLNNNSTATQLDIELDQLLLGNNITISYDVKVTEDPQIAPLGSTHTNEVLLNWDTMPEDPQEERSYNDDARETVTIFGPDLLVLKTTQSSEVQPGDSFEYTISITNKDGPYATAAVGVTLTDILPTDVSFISSTNDQIGVIVPMVINGHVVWQIPQIAPGQTINFTVTVQVEDPASACNEILHNTAIGELDTQIEPTPIDNTSTVDTPLDAQPDYAVTITDNLTTITPGSPVTYVINVANNGNQDGHNVTVTHNFPTLFIDVVSASLGGVIDENAGTVTWDIANFPAGGFAIELTVQALVNENTPPETVLINTVSVEDEIIQNEDGSICGGEDPNLEDNFDSDTTTVIANLFGFSIFDNPLLEIEDEQRLINPILPIAPLYTGTAVPGSTLVVEIVNSKGVVIGSQTIVADEGGNWLARFPTLSPSQNPEQLRITQVQSTSTNTEADTQLFKHYFRPASDGQFFVSEQITTGGVMNDQPARSLLNLYKAALTPVPADWEMEAYEYYTSQGSQKGY